MVPPMSRQRGACADCGLAGWGDDVATFPACHGPCASFLICGACSLHHVCRPLAEALPLPVGEHLLVRPEIR